MLTSRQEADCKNKELARYILANTPLVEPYERQKPIRREARCAQGRSHTLYPLININAEGQSVVNDPIAHNYCRWLYQR